MSSLFFLRLLISFPLLLNTIRILLCRRYVRVTAEARPLQIIERIIPFYTYRSDALLIKYLAIGI